MSIRMIMITTPQGNQYEFQITDISAEDARTIDVALSKAGFTVEREKDPIDVRPSIIPSKETLDDFYGD